MTTSKITDNIDGTYPIAGQDNDSQGFRDNFTNIRNNFVFVKSEIEDLQNRAVLKSKLTAGNPTDLDNRMAYEKITNVQLQSYSESFYKAVDGDYVIDFNRGNAQQITTTQSGTIVIQNWPNAPSKGTQLSRILLYVKVENAAHKITLPANCDGFGALESIAGISGLTITYPAIGDYFYEFLTTDGGTNIFVHELGRDSSIAAITAETAARITGDAANATAIANEATTRASADSANATNILAEKNRALAEEAALSGRINTEVAARTNGDATNATAITAEQTRAVAAESTLTTSVANEVARAQAAEGVLTNSVTALLAEVQSLKDRVAALEAANNPPANP